ncbi:hypothetical protein G436_3378 [Leptospira interrogans serovar Hardjo str. Norma]|uniref:Uncharacterized protein n=1 Tax=Leptospira interrogans serovar Hardjo str. Norma TaxID=1279460 RepID=A0A0M3TMB2_LEPIR|nr:hypothetical protein G436_3378 [Leptospira interrogans serovar Hardjo str. Norma]
MSTNNSFGKRSADLLNITLMPVGVEHLIESLRILKSDP